MRYLLIPLLLLSGIVSAQTKLPATLIVPDAMHRFTSDTEKANWNSLQATKLNVSDTSLFVRKLQGYRLLNPSELNVKLNVSDTSVLVRKIAGSRLITPAEIQKLGNVPSGGIAVPSIASQAEALLGSDNGKMMTPYLTKLVNDAVKAAVYDSLRRIKFTTLFTGQFRKKLIGTDTVTAMHEDSVLAIVKPSFPTVTQGANVTVTSDGNGHYVINGVSPIAVPIANKWEYNVAEFENFVPNPRPSAYAIQSTLIYTNVSGTGATNAVAGVSTHTNESAVYTSKTGTTSTGISAVVTGIFGSGGVHKFPTKRLVAQGGVATNLMPTASDNFQVYLGISSSVNTPTAPIFAGIRIRYDSTSNLVQYHAISRSSAGNETVTAISSITATTFFEYKVVVAADRSSVTFYVNDIVVATHTTNVPNTTNTAVMFIQQIRKLTGTTDAWLYHASFWPHVTAFNDRIYPVDRGRSRFSLMKTLIPTAA